MHPIYDIIPTLICLAGVMQNMWGAMTPPPPCCLFATQVVILPATCHLAISWTFYIIYTAAYLDIGLTGVCRWDVIGIVPIAIRSLALWGIEGIDVLRLNVIGILGPGRKKVPLYISDELSLATSSSLFSLHFPSAKTLWVLASPSLLLSVVVHAFKWGLLWVICLWLLRWATLLHLVSLARQ